MVYCIAAAGAHTKARRFQRKIVKRESLLKILFV